MKENENNDNFFHVIGNTNPFLKIAFEGFAGSGKTYTATIVAIGLHKQISSKKPIVFFDTESASHWLKPKFDEAGIQCIVKKSKSLADLRETMRRCRDGLSDILIIDSITHIWGDLQQTYINKMCELKKIKSYDIQWQDWGKITPAWMREFAEPFRDDPYHIIMCGRAGYEYENEVDEKGKRQIYRSGIKMKAQNETAHEPDFLFLMERYEDIMGAEINIYNQATIIKDRSDLLDRAKPIKNPTFDDFYPAIRAVLSNPILDNSESPRNAGELIEIDEQINQAKQERKIVLDEVETFLAKFFPSNTGKDKQQKILLIEKAYGTTSFEKVELKYSTKQIKEGFEIIKEYAKQQQETKKEEVVNA